MTDLIKIPTKAVLLAKIETTYGTDPTPTGAANAIRVEDLKIEIISRKIVRNYVIPFMGKRSQVNAGEGLKITFKTELKGSGTAGTAPEIGPLLRASNFTETLVAVTSATYAPNSSLDGAESITIYFYLDGLLHKLLGCRGDFNVEANAGGLAMIAWEFTGIYAGPTDAANASPTLNATIPPRFLSAAFAIDSYAAIIDNLKINIGNEIAKRPSANAATGILSYIIKQRGVTGSIDPEVPTLATKSFWNLWSQNTLAALTAAVGATAGNICTITAPKVQVDDLKYSERDGILTHDLPLIFTPNAGNDEVVFAFT